MKIESRERQVVARDDRRPVGRHVLQALDPGPEQQPQPRTQENELQQPVEHRVLLRHPKTTGAQARWDNDGDRPRRDLCRGGRNARHSSAGRATMEGQRRQGGALWASCPARSRSPPRAARSAWCSATASPARRRACGRGPSTWPAAGLTVRLPRLPGHGTRWQDLNDTRWPDWYGEVERALRRPARPLPAGVRHGPVDGRHAGHPAGRAAPGRGRRPGAGQPVAAAASARTSSMPCRCCTGWSRRSPGSAATSASPA